MRIRPATEADLERINELYNTGVETTTSWSDTPMPLDDRVEWFAKRQAAGDAVLVADDGGQVVGFASFAEFRDNRKWNGYRFTAEVTIFVDDACQGQGVGRQLYEALFAAARERGLHVLVAAVDAETEGSLAFHRALGFVEVARMPETGFKFGRWLDLVLLQRFVDA